MFGFALITVSAIAGFVGCQAQDLPAPETLVIERPIPYQVEVTVTRTIEIPVQVPVTVTVTPDPVIQIVPQQARWFESMEELETWLDAHPPTRRFYADENGNLGADPRWDCEDYGEELQREALEDGYLLPVLPMGIFLPAPGPHVANWTWIDGQTYSVEPQNGEIKWILNLD